MSIKIEFDEIKKIYSELFRLIEKSLNDELVSDSDEIIKINNEILSTYPLSEKKLIKFRENFHKSKEENSLSPKLTQEITSFFATLDKKFQGIQTALNFKSETIKNQQIGLFNQLNDNSRALKATKGYLKISTKQKPSKYHSKT